MSLSISEHVEQCLQSFQATLSNQTLFPLTAARLQFQDEFARFKLWSGNIGAHRKGRSSLDWRLRDASHLRGLVINLLVDLNEALRDLDKIGLAKKQSDESGKSVQAAPAPTEKSQNGLFHDGKWYCRYLATA
jgi:hypothetical protein